MQERGIWEGASRSSGSRQANQEALEGFSAARKVFSGRQLKNLAHLSTGAVVHV